MIETNSACVANTPSGEPAGIQRTMDLPNRLPASVSLQPKTLPKVAILLCTFQGQHYLSEQLDSFAAQTHTNWEVWTSDDRSQDRTHAILGAYKSRWAPGKLNVRVGPADGFAANFLSLTCGTNIEADYYAYSDQDDIWEPDKLERAVNWLKTIPRDTPALYCSRTRLVDADNNDIGLSRLVTKPPSFANALIQSLGGGNTMVFNNATRELLRKAGESVAVVSHDWWAYMVVTGCGGRVCYDDYPSLRYRQHENNLVGTNTTLAARLHRARAAWQGLFKHWMDVNVNAITCLRDHLTPENRETLDQFVRARNSRLIPRLVALRRSGVYRQSLVGNCGLIVAAVLKKM